jgi:ribosomal protein S18 acetylase RimI-like enzyme
VVRAILGLPLQLEVSGLIAEHDFRNSCHMCDVDAHRGLPDESKQMFLVRKASVLDARAISACLSSAFAAYRSRYTAEAYARTVLSTELVQNRMAQMELFVAVSEGAIVGTHAYSLENREGHLRGMAVLPEWQGTGVASALLQSAEEALRVRGCERVVLGTTELLARAIHFYQRHGFYSTGRVYEFFGMRLYEYCKCLPA